MDSPRRRSWDVAPLILAGVVVGLVGPLLLAGSAEGWSAALAFSGLVLSLTGLVRWSRRPQHRAVSTAPSRPTATPVN